LVAACGGAERAVLPTASPSVVEVSFTTSGADPDPDGYLVALDTAAARRVGPNASTNFTVDPGSHTLRLTGVGGNCRASGESTRGVSLAAGQHLTIAIAVACTIRQVAFTSDRGGTFQVYLMNRDGSNIVRLTNGTNEFPSGWSPDGATLAVTSNSGTTRQVFLIDADGSNRRQLTTVGNNVGGSWSPDGKRLAFTSTRDGNSELYVMNVDGTDQRRLTNTAGDEDNPQWSPDGARIAYTVFTGLTLIGPDYNIFIMNADGSGVRELLAGPFDKRSPGWSPDGTSITFVRRAGPFNDHAERINVWTISADGSQPRRLTFITSSDAYVPRWSPDGTMLSYSVLVGGKDQLHIIGPDGTDSRILPQSTSSDYYMVWRP
jgi:Tol biopolymer transport system component